MSGKCMCGDPCCPSCGDPDLGKLENLTDQFYEIIKDQPVAVAEACVINTKHFIESLREFSPLLIREVSDSISDATSRAKAELTEHAKELELEDN